MAENHQRWQVVIQVLVYFQVDGGKIVEKEQKFANLLSHNWLYSVDELVVDEFLNITQLLFIFDVQEFDEL